MYRMEENPHQVTLGVSSLIGTRPDQQDSVYGEILEDSLVAIICDGMGGLEGGALASQTAIQTFAEDYEKRDITMSIPRFLQQEAIEMDTVVSELRKDNGGAMNAGTTVAAIVIQKDQLYWLGVGDSRIYIIRHDEIMAVNRDHNYQLRLDQALQDGFITQQEYDEELDKAEALISYIGIGNVSLMDINQKPFSLLPQDVIVVCSDGLYRSLSDEEIRDIVKEHLPNTQSVAEGLTENAVLASLEQQDNTSVVVVQYLGRNNEE